MDNRLLHGIHQNKKMEMGEAGKFRIKASFRTDYVSIRRNYL